MAKNVIVGVENVFVTPQIVVLYFGTPFLLIPVIKVVKKLIKQRTCENIKISRIHFKRADRGFIDLKFVKISHIKVNLTSDLAALWGGVVTL